MTARTRQSFCVPKEGIAAQGYDLLPATRSSFPTSEHRAPLGIMDDLEKLEGEIQSNLAELRVMLS